MRWQVCLEYLERYYVLIAVASYLLEPDFDVANPDRLTFGRWLAQRPELHRCVLLQGSCAVAALAAS